MKGTLFYVYGSPLHSHTVGSSRQMAPAFHYQDQLQSDAQILHKHPDPKDVKAGGDLRETQTGEASSPMLHMSNGVKIKF